MNWDNIYRRKVADPATALACLESGQAFIWAAARARPRC